MLSESDISVTIGSEDCHVTSMSATQLTCKPSFDDVGGISRATLDSKPVVAVRVSVVFQFVINLLSRHSAANTVMSAAKFCS